MANTRASTHALSQHEREFHENWNAIYHDGLTRIRLAVAELALRTPDNAYAEIDIIERSKLHRFLGNTATRKLTDRGQAHSFSISEYTMGHQAEATSKDRYHVAEHVRGWIVPGALSTTADKPYMKLDRSKMRATRLDTLIIAEDGRSWNSGLVHNVYGRPETYGVQSSSTYGHHAIEGMTALAVPTHTLVFGDKGDNGVKAMLENIESAITALHR